MRTWFISDTHGYHERLIIPEDIDLIIHSGDCSNSRDILHNSIECQKFFDWYNEVDVMKIYVPGNHDTSLEKGLIPNFNGIYLNHKEYCLNGRKFFGSPFSPSFGRSWAFMKQRNKLSAVWETIPDDTDILITHGPPKYMLDIAYDIDQQTRLKNVGCASLFKRVMKIKPRIHCFGHIHDNKGIYNSGVRKYKDITFINASCLTHFNTLNNGVVLNI